MRGKTRFDIWDYVVVVTPLLRGQVSHILYSALYETDWCRLVTGWEAAYPTPDEMLASLLDNCRAEVKVEDFIDPDEGKSVHTIRRKDVRKGLQVLANKYPLHFKDLVEGDDDGLTADVYLQCVLFGEVRYNPEP